MTKVKISKIFLFIFLGASLASAKDIPNLATEIKTRLESSPASAFAWMESLGTSSEVCDIYSQAVKDLYWLDKGAKSLVVVGGRGISFCLEQSAKSSSELAMAFKAQAKTIAYNVAANSWPGWGDAGVVITPSETAKGLEAARLNLSLAIELNKPADKIAGAFWLLSAMHLALEQHAEALIAIDQSNAYATEAGDQTLIAYGKAFKGLILIASGSADEGSLLFNSGILTLKSIGTEDAHFYASQLEVALKIFVK